MTNNCLIGEDTEFVLANDIDFEGKQISPWFSSAFTGTFDGNDKKILNFKLSILDEENRAKGEEAKLAERLVALEGVEGEDGKVEGGVLNEAKAYTDAREVEIRADITVSLPPAFVNSTLPTTELYAIPPWLLKILKIFLLKRPQS